MVFEIVIVVLHTARIVQVHRDIQIAFRELTVFEANVVVVMSNFNVAAAVVVAFAVVSVSAAPFENLAEKYSFSLADVLDKKGSMLAHLKMILSDCKNLIV